MQQTLRKRTCVCVCGGWGARDRELVGRSVGCVEGLPRLTCATAPASASGHEGCAEVNGETGKQATPNSAPPTPLDAEKGGKQQREPPTPLLSCAPRIRPPPLVIFTRVQRTATSQSTPPLCARDRARHHDFVSAVQCCRLPVAASIGRSQSVQRTT